MTRESINTIKEQQELFASVPKPAKIVNVASVPHRSPFRYAGGKTWLIPRIRRWLNRYGGKDIELIEPFAGGGIVSLSAVMENLVGSVTMVELDEDVAAVWHVIIEGDADWLAHRIVTFDLRAVAMKNTHHAKKRELLIGRDLSWLPL